MKGTRDDYAIGISISVLEVPVRRKDVTAEAVSPCPGWRQLATMVVAVDW